MSKRLLDCEWILLKSLWGRQPQTMKQIVQTVRDTWPDIEWNYKTFHSYLRKMEEKGLVSSETRNLKDKLYAALITQEEAIKAESDSILARSSYFGSVGRLMAAIMDNTQLSAKDRAELVSFAQKLEKEDSE